MYKVALLATLKMSSFFLHFQDFDCQNQEIFNLPLFYQKLSSFIDLFFLQIFENLQKSIVSLYQKKTAKSYTFEHTYARRLVIGRGAQEGTERGLIFVEIRHMI